MRATVLTTLALAGAALLAGTPVAPAAAQTTVDQMTCGGAIRSAAITRRYYKRTGFGVVPIMPVFPYAGRTVCGITEWEVPQVERTRDTPRCVIGYKCQERDDFWRFGW